MDQTRDEVRIMTVHAAKGLEASVVFLVDSGSAPFHNQHLPRLMPFVPRGVLLERRAICGVRRARNSARGRGALRRRSATAPTTNIAACFTSA